MDLKIIKSECYIAIYFRIVTMAKYNESLESFHEWKIKTFSPCFIKSVSELTCWYQNTSSSQLRCEKTSIKKIKPGSPQVSIFLNMLIRITNFRATICNYNISNVWTFWFIAILACGLWLGLQLTCWQCTETIKRIKGAKQFSINDIYLFWLLSPW